jgi:hypothetical protein
MAKVHVVPLTVQPGVQADEYRDIVRIHHDDRSGIPSGTLIKIAVHSGADRRQRIFAVRGLRNANRGQIRLDSPNQDNLNVELNKTYPLEIAETSLLDKLHWVTCATDPAIRVAAWLAIWSGIIGILGFVVGIVGIIY